MPLKQDEYKIIVSMLDKTSSVASGINNSIKSIGANVMNLQNLFRGLIYSAPFLALAGAIKKAVDAGDELLKMSKQTGISVENLSKLKYAAEVSETSIDSLNVGMRAFQNALAGTNDEGKDTTILLRSLGVTAKDPFEALQQVSAAMRDIGDASIRSKVSVELFGKSGRDLIPLLLELKEALEDAKKNAHIFNKEDAEAAATFNDNITRIKANLNGLVFIIANKVIPVFNDMFAAMGKGPKLDNLYSQLASLDAELKRLEEGPLSKIGIIPEKQIAALKKQRQKILDELWGLQQPVIKGEEVTPKFAPEKKGKGEEKTDRWAFLGMLKYQADLEKDEEAMLKALREKEIDAHQWLTDKTMELTLSEFDFKRMKLLEDYQLRADVIGWTENLYQTFTDDLKKIGNEEAENKLNNLNAIREAELKHNLAMIDLAEQEFRISKPEAIRQRIDAYQKLQGIQEESLAQIDKLSDASSWYAQQEAIDQTRESLLELNLALKEQTGTLLEGLIEGINRYHRDAQTAFQGGLEIVNSVTQGMTSAFESFFDYTSDKFMNFKELALNVLNDIQKALTRTLIIEPIVQGFMGLFTPASVGEWQGPLQPGQTYHQGGQITYVPRFDTGGENRLVMAKIGERFITREQNEWLTSQAKTNKKEDKQKQIISISINAVDARSFADLVNRNPGAIIKPVMTALQRNSALRYEIMEGM
jgi:lambda family phage tail tape measure protein